MEFFIAVGLMLSPRAFMALGNATGLLEGWFFALLALLLLWGLACWACHRAIAAAHPELPVPAAEARAIRSVLGPLAQWLMPLARLLLCTALATSVLALAGFAFNEVFAHRFPNLGFTFVLLTLICGTQLFSDRVPRILQAVCASGAVLGFGAIALAGAFTGAEQGAHTTAGLRALGLLAALAPAAVLFMGLELGDASRGARGGVRVPSGLVALLVMACLFGLFAKAAQRHVPLEQLAYSSVPHMSAARRILGETGRYLAGGAVILGSVAAVNALLLAWRVWLARRLAHPVPRAAATALLPFAAVALLLWGGYAGEPVLESWIAGATSLYFLAYAALGLAARRLPSRPFAALPAAVLSLVLAGATLYGASQALG